MHKVTFYPVGNGDTSQIVLANGKRILFDYHHLKKSESNEGPEINLKAQLRKELREANKKSFDVVAFTHGDDDHIGGSTDFFELRHSPRFQGGERVPIDELWVPAAMVLEEGTHANRQDEFVLWRQEARHRLREGKGIRVFSKPEKLKSWCEKDGTPFESRRHLITDAGQTVDGFRLETDGVEFFCHSPFVKHVDEGRDEMRNSCALIFNIRFKAALELFDFLAIGDSDWDVLEDVVRITQAHGNEDRLRWDLFNIPHHCSYLALSDEKGVHETVPKPRIEQLLRMGRQGAFMISSSGPIRDEPSAYDQIQPPHVQARNCYRRRLEEQGGAQFLVTMEEPNSSRPEPVVFKIETNGITRERRSVTTPSMLISPPPRAG